MMILFENKYSMSVYERDGYDFKVAVVFTDSKACNFYYLEDEAFTFISGLRRNDGSDLTAEDILSHLTLLFQDE